MKIIKADKSDYESFVLANGSFLQDWNWGEFQESLGQKVFRFLIQDDGGEILAAAQGILHSAMGKKYLFVPHGPALSPEGKGMFSEVIAFFAREAAQIIPGLFFIRIEPEFIPDGHALADRKMRKSIDLDPHKTLVLDLTQSEDDILQQMHPKTRYNIKVAQKHNVAVNSQTEMKGCGVLLLETARRAGIRSFDLEYYEKLLKFLCAGETVKARLYTAWHGDDLLAVNLMIYHRKTATYLFGGSATVKRNMMAPYLLHWEAITFAKADGYADYDFWGIEEDKKHPWYGFSRFKLGFGGEVRKYAGTWDYVLNPAWYNAYVILRKLNRKLKK